jgi:hypothetical protein
MYGANYVFHAAALKEVPSCEFFPMEAVRTNIIGTDNVITAAVEAVTQKKLNPKYEGYVHGVGMMLLLGLMALIMFKDIFVIFKG